MERIDIHNYEAYLLDFSDGTLPAEQQVELELFLIQHPELNIDLAELGAVSEDEEHILYSGKNNLKRSESDLVSESQFIAYIEQQLPLRERIHLEKSCEINSSLLKELNLYKKTITTPDTSIIYSNKNELKRKSALVWFDFSFTHYAAAACVLFLIGLFLLWPGTDSVNHNTQFANKSKVNSELKMVKDSPSSVQSQIALKTAVQMSIGKLNKQISNGVSSHQKPINISKDTLMNKGLTSEPVSELKSVETLIASTVAPITRQSNTIVQVITENEEEPEIKAEPRKKGLWGMASRALKNLNHAGLKSVNGDERLNNQETGYALTLGGLNIVHKPATL